MLVIVIDFLRSRCPISIANTEKKASRQAAVNDFPTVIVYWWLITAIPVIERSLNDRLDVQRSFRLTLNDHIGPSFLTCVPQDQESRVAAPDFIAQPP
jgi:hypothetical protein